jgi:lipopolysaccharide transport system ATP-binding protein
MSSDVVIRAEALSKKYVIGHETERERYTALRDVLARRAKVFLRTTTDILRGRAIVVGDTTEEFWALNDVDFEVKRGEIVGIIGRNGAGKTTLLKILARITEPTAGQVEIRGRVASLLEVGTGFHPELTGRENVFLNGAVLGMSRAEIRRKFDEIVAFAEVDKFLDTPVKRYSSGMYVRLAFAVAAHLEPEILLVDEVLAVGDAEFQKKCIGKMSEVAGGGRTVLFVSHNMNAIERLCVRVLYLEGGRLEGSYDNVRMGISAYLRSVDHAAGRTAWLNTGSDYHNEYFVPQRLEVSSLNDRWQYDEAFSNNYPIQVLIEGAILRADPAQNVGIAVYDENDLLLFWSFSSDAEEEHWPTMKVGPIALRTVIPQHFLNEGTYRLELLASHHHRAWLLEPGTNVPSVTFSIRGGLSNSPHWDRKRAGILAPVLNWQALPIDKKTALEASS